MKNLLVIGKGPAGISAAIYASRAGIPTMIIGKDYGALSKADKVENYYGFAEPISGMELVERGITQAKRLGIQIIDEEVTDISYDGEFVVKTPSGFYQSTSLILATGAHRSSPNIQGIKEYEGKGISYCAVCDAFFYKGQDVAVVGCCEYALHEALELLPIANSVTLLTNSINHISNIPESIFVITDRIVSFNGDQERLTSVSFENQEDLSVSGVFIAVGVAGSNEFSKKLGIETINNRIVTSDKKMTNIPGLFAVGDCTGGMYQISKAVYDGSVAGMEVVQYLRGLSL